MHKLKTRDHSLISFLIGIGAAIMLCLILTASLSQLLLSQTIGEGSVAIAISVILLLSSMLGNILTAKICGKQALITIVITTVIMIVMMFLGSLVAEGVFQDVLLRVAPVAAGGMIAFALCMKKGSTKSVGRKKRYR